MEEIEQQKILRVFKLLRLLKQKPHKTKPQLAKILSVTVKTITRYIELLEEIGYCIDKHVSNKTYFLFEEEESPVPEHPTVFNEEEAALLKHLIEISQFELDVKKAVVQKMYVNSELDTLTLNLVNKHHARIVAIVKKAIEMRKQVKLINYYSANSNSTSDRIIEPVEFERNSLVAYEVSSKQLKIFNLERIGQVKILNKKMTYKGGGLQKDVFNMSGDQPIAIKLKLDGQAYHLLVKEFERAKAFTNPLGDSYYLFEGNVFDFRGIGRFILGLPGQIEIIEPNELSEFIQEKVKLFGF